MPITNLIRNNSHSILDKTSDLLMENCHCTGDGNPRSIHSCSNHLVATEASLLSSSPRENSHVCKLTHRITRQSVTGVVKGMAMADSSGKQLHRWDLKKNSLPLYHVFALQDSESFYYMTHDSSSNYLFFIPDDSLNLDDIDLDKAEDPRLFSPGVGDILKVAKDPNLSLTIENTFVIAKRSTSEAWDIEE